MTPLAPDPGAYWIWPRPNCNAQNCYAGFRHDFEISALPSAAPLVITADQSYRLWVNGRYVCRGPLRGHQSHWFYDTVELLSYLKPGKNWISVEAHNPGISFYSYTYRDRAGFLCSAEWDNGTKIVTRLDSWLVFRNTAYNPKTGRLSMQMGFQEELDLRADDRSWIFAEADYTITPQPEWFTASEFPQGTLPWSALAPRPTELLEEKFTAPAKLLSFGTGECSRTPAELPFDDNNFIRDFAIKELPSFCYQKELPACRVENDALCFTLPAPGEGRYAAVLLDLGRLEWLPGTAYMETETQDDSAVADLAFLHYLTGDKIAFESFPSQGSLCAPGARFHLHRGHSVCDAFQLTGTRYAALILRGNRAPVQIRFAWRSAVSKLDIRGKFQCSDAELNDIAALSLHTQRCCTLDTFVDTPWREQSQWWGDARVQAKNVFFLTGSSRILEQGIRSIAGQPGPEGLLFANAPTTSCGPVLPDYCLTWLQTLYDFYQQTGRTDLFAEYKERAEQILAYFERQRGDDGLIRYDRRFWLFEDWSTLPKRNTPAFLNLLFYYTRQIYAELLAVSGFPAEADTLRRVLKAEQKRLTQAFWSEKEELYMPEINEKGERTGVPSVHDQVLALLCDLAPERAGKLIEKRILPCLRGELGDDVAKPSSFWATYLLGAAQKYGLIREALAYLRRSWRPMLPGGTAWEHFVEPQYAAASVCHAWSGHPLYHLPELFFGLRQLAPRWEKIELAPAFLTESADFEFPAPSGILKCRWDKEIFTAELPAGMSAELHLAGEIFPLTGPVVFQQKRKEEKK